MRMRVSGDCYTDEQYQVIDPFIQAIETMCLQYALACFLDMRVTWYSHERGTYSDPYLMFLFRWTPDVLIYTFEAKVTLEDIVALNEEGQSSFDIYVYHFARLMISSIALSLKDTTKPVDQSAWQGEQYDGEWRGVGYGQGGPKGGGIGFDEMKGVDL